MQEQNKATCLLCKRILYNTEYMVWGIWSLKVAWASRSPKPPNIRRYVWVWKCSYFLWYQEIFLHWILMWTVPVTFSTTTYCTKNQSDLQGKYKLWSFCNALLPNQFAFAKWHVARSRWRWPSEGRVVVVWGMTKRLYGPT